MLKLCDSKGRCYTEEQLASISNFIENGTAEQVVNLAWRPIEELPAVYKCTRRMFVVRGYIEKHNYKTDPYCVWHDNGIFYRWPHPFPPSEFMEIPR